MSDLASAIPGRIGVMLPNWTRSPPWKIPRARLSPDGSRFHDLRDRLHALLAAEGPFIRPMGSPVAIAYLYPTLEKLAWHVVLLGAGIRSSILGAYACVRVSMESGHRHLVEAYANERKLRRVKATLSIPVSDRERCQKAAYLTYVAANLQNRLLRARVDAMRWRPPEVQYELPAPIGLD